VNSGPEPEPIDIKSLALRVAIPFSCDRIRFRRQSGSQMPLRNSLGVFRFGDFDLDLASAELRRHGIRIQLQSQPLKILALLLEHSGEVVGREVIRENIWPDGTFVDFEHGLNTAIRKLRKALDDDAANPKLIETIPRIGYRFMGAVTSSGYESNPVDSGPSDDAAAQSIFPTHPAASQTSSSTHWGLIGTAVVVVIAVSVFLAWKHFSPVRQPITARVIHSVAVLPLENLTGNPDQEYLVDGLTDSLITNIAKIRSLAVISRTSVMAYKNTHKPMREIARELNVDAVVEGSVSESNGIMRVNAQLVRGDSDTHLWAGQFEGDLKNVLRLQSEVTESIATQIHAEIVPTNRPDAPLNFGVNSQAYEPYLRGEYFLNKRDNDSFATAIGYFQQAIAADPNFAQAYSGLADCYILQVLNGAPADRFEKARAAAEHSLSLDEDLPEAHASLGSLNALYDRKWPDAEREFQRAIELNPSFATAHQWYAVLYLAPLGRLDEALVEIERAHELDPLSAIILTDRGFVHYLRREYSMAIQDFQKTLELDPTFVPAHFRLANAYEKLGRFDEDMKQREAIARIDQSKLRPSAEDIEKAYQSGGFQAFQKVMDSTDSKFDDVNADFGKLRASEGDINGAFQIFFKLNGKHDTGLFYILVEPEFDPIRSDPRYEKLLHQVGVPSSIEKAALHRSN
jgi:TolB-like protein/DNA-binding winged helix-turn-helix (wHTH) protein/Flp pilus assembly protein TadD